MIVNVEGYNKQVEFPDGTAPETIKRVLAERFPPLQPPPRPAEAGIPPFDIDEAVLGFEFADENTPRDVSAVIHPFVRPYLATGYTAAASVNKGIATMATHLDTMADYVAAKTGTRKGDLFKDAAKKFQENVPYWQDRANKVGVSFLEELVGEAVGGAVPGVAEFVLNIPYAALLGASEAHRKGESELAGALVEGAKRGVLGAVFHAMGPLKQYLRAPVMGSVFALQTATEGGGERDIAKGFGTGLLYSLTSPGGQMGLNDLRRNMDKTIVRSDAERKAEASQETYRGYVTRQIETGQMRRLSSTEVDGLVKAFERFPLGKSVETPLGEEIRFSPPMGVSPEQYAHHFLVKYDQERQVETYSGKYKNLVGEIENTIRSYDERILGENKGQDRIYYVREFQPDAKSPHHVLVVSVDGKGTFRGWTHFEAREGYKDSLLNAEKALIEKRGLVDGYGEPVNVDYLGYSSEKRRTPLYLGSGADSGLQHPQGTPPIAGSSIGQTEGKVKRKNEPEGGASQAGEEGSLSMVPEAGFRREPTSVGAANDPIARRSDLVRFLTEKLDIPIRTGRFTERALGIFKPKSEVIRTRNANDIEVISHEIGHAIHKYLYPESLTARGLSANPFSAFAGELTPMATKPKAGQAVVPEGFAEFVRLYVTDPVQAQVKAPSFYRHFERLLGEKTPETLEILKAAGDHYRKWLEQPALQRVLSSVSVNGRGKREVSLDRLYTLAVDDLHPLKQVVEEMGKGRKIAAGEDPYRLARLFRGWSGKVDAFLRHGPFEFGTYRDAGKPLQEILKPLDGRLDEFRAYVVSRRTLELLAREKPVETGILRADAEQIVQRYEAEFSRTFADLKEYQDHTLNYLRDSGVLSAEAYAKIKALNEDYVPLYRVMEGAEGKGGAGAGLEARNPIRRIEGSWRDIQDPLESIVKNTYLYINLAEKNAVGEALVKMAEQNDGLGKFVEKIPDPMQGVKVTTEELATWAKENGLEGLDPAALEALTVFRKSAFVPKENVISVWRNGERSLYEVHPDIARTFQALDRESVGILTKLLSYPASWLRAGATLTPEFIARNPIRDQFSAFIYSKYGFVPGVDLMRGIFHLAGKTDMYWAWKKAGGDHSMLVSMDRAYMQDRLADVLQKYPVRNLIRNPMEALRVLSELGEAGTRIGEFAKGIAAEGMTKEGMQAAGIAAREVTLDFARKGAGTKAINMITAFWNAGLQGQDKMIRAFVEDPAGAAWKTAVAITLPSVLLAIWNHDDPRVKDIPQWQRDLFWIIPANRMTQERWDDMTPQEKAAQTEWFSGTVFRIAKPFELGILFGSIPERITRYLLDQDPHAFDGLLQSVMRAGTPGILPTAAVPLVENWANRSTFFDRPIVPQNRTDVLSEHQYGPYTTETAKAIGKVLGKLPWMDTLPVASPAKIENLIYGWTGGMGRYALGIADSALDAAGIARKDYERPAKALADYPLIKAFVVRYPSAGTENITRFYDESDAIAKKTNSIKAMQREFRFDEALRILEGGDLANVKGIRDALTNVHHMIDSVTVNPALKPEEKREFIDILYMQMTDLAKAGNEHIDNIRALEKRIRADREKEIKFVPPAEGRREKPSTGQVEFGGGGAAKTNPASGSPGTGGMPTFQ